MRLTPLNLKIFRLFTVEKETKSKQRCRQHRYLDDGAAVGKIISDKERCVEK
jgi:hypothetical protein